jgi:hypothetical protein
MPLLFPSWNLLVLAAARAALDDQTQLRDADGKGKYPPLETDRERGSQTEFARYAASFGRKRRSRSNTRRKA